ncbi:glycosyltransferase [Planctomicrobium sp. SH664]|uniref:glycosyltransferase n=1 Tax=Planctomicrobium sp. SH664 TaxID=3448125 RepID=UPI003F5B63E1
MPRSNPTVSVLTITYNHERFIEGTLRSALSQQTDFDFEIVVGEDCSTDSTREILLRLQQQFPDRLRLILQPRNVGLMQNFVETFRACRGKYIALMEGDDYWTNDTKLQQQVDFLNAHPDCVITHHNVWKVIEGTAGHPETWHPRSDRARWQTLEQMLSSNIIVTCSALFRAGLFNKFPDWYLQAEAPDWLLHLLNARHGRVWYDPQVMAAYRIHPSSVWSTSPRIVQLKRILRHAGMIRGELTPPQQYKLDASSARWHEEIVELLIQDGRRDEARHYSALHLRDDQGLQRLLAFADGLELEKGNRRWAANLKFVQALLTGIGKTRIGIPDVLLAFVRNTFPGVYYRLRQWHRERQSAGST